jgi:hypothetical protein
LRYDPAETDIDGAKLLAYFSKASRDRRRRSGSFGRLRRWLTGAALIAMAGGPELLIGYVL